MFTKEKLAEVTAAARYRHGRLDRPHGDPKPPLVPCKVWAADRLYRTLEDHPRGGTRAALKDAIYVFMDAYEGEQTTEKGNPEEIA